MARRPWYSSASDASTSAAWRLTSLSSLPSSVIRVGTSCSCSESAFTFCSWLERSVFSVVSVKRCVSASVEERVSTSLSTPREPYAMHREVGGRAAISSSSRCSAAATVGVTNVEFYSTLLPLIRKHRQICTRRVWLLAKLADAQTAGAGFNKFTPRELEPGTGSEK